MINGNCDAYKEPSHIFVGADDILSAAVVSKSRMPASGYIWRLQTVKL